MKKLKIITTKHKATDTRIVEKQLFTLESLFNIDFQHSDSSNRSMYTYTKNSKFGLIKSLLDQSYQIIIVHDLDSIIISSLFCSILNRKQKKVIADIHEDYPLQIKNKKYIFRPFRIVLSHIMRLIFPTILSQFNGVIYATDSIYSKYNKRVKTKQCFIRNYPKFELLKTNSKKEYDIGYVGSITEERGALRILEIIKLGYKVLLIGPLNDNLSRKCFGSDQISNMSNLTYMGELPYRKAMAEIAKVKIGLLPLLETKSYAVSLPVKLFEYLCLDIYVIASNFEYWQKEFGHFSQIHFLDFDNLQITNNKIKSILNDSSPTLKENINQFSWESEEQKLIDFVSNI